MAERREPATRRAAVVALILLAGSTAGYAILHKPLTPQVALASARSAWAITAALALLALAGGLGRRI
ncbi:MAG: hypothetical protein ACRDG5_03400, partial [Anaerolineales bacterium]